MSSYNLSTKGTSLHAWLSVCKIPTNNSLKMKTNSSLPQKKAHTKIFALEA